MTFLYMKTTKSSETAVPRPFRDIALELERWPPFRTPRPFRRTMAATKTIGIMKGGEIIQVEGGHIIRSTGRKDRHSKVYTAKGPRDRRVRLSAHTAIQFYDVQDRLGYDRPSKAVDWLILKAKNAINELPPWNPAPTTDNAVALCSLDSNQSSSELLLDQQSEEAPTNSEYPLIHFNDNINNNYNRDGSGSSLIIQPDAANLVYSMKSFFPTNSMSYPDFSNDVIPRDSFQAEDLGLSLQSLRAENNNGRSTNNNSLLSGSSSVGFQESFQRMDNWNNGGSTGTMEDSRIHGFLMNSQVPGIFSPGFPFSQRELLQSNLSVHAWNNEYRPLATTDHQNPPPQALQFSDSGSHFALGFHVPTPIHGDHDEETNH